MHKHLKAPLVPADQINPELSAGICEIIEVCMAKNRNERYNSTSDLIQDIEAVTRGEPPLQARRKFDLSSLASLEQKTESAEVPKVVEAVDRRPAVEIPLLEQPVFWLAAIGWGLATLLLLVVIYLALRPH